MVKLRTGPALLLSFFILALLLATAAFIFFGFCPHSNWTSISNFFGFSGLLSPLVFFIIFSTLTRKWRFLGTVFLTYLTIAGSLFLAFNIEKQISMPSYSRYGHPIPPPAEKCSPDHFRAQDYLGGCPSCDNLIAFKATAEECSKCPERELKEGKCILKTCPSDYPIRHPSDLSCESCSYWHPASSKTECAKCENLAMDKGYCLPRTGMAERFEKENRFEVPYVNGKIHGTMKIYNRDGNLIQTDEIYLGTKNGLVTTFNAKGEITGIKPYKNGLLNGKVEYYPTHDGKPEQPFGVKQVTDYVAGEREGLSLVYHANGKIRQETQYKNNKENGYDRLYDTQGNILIDSVFKDGKMIESYCFWKDGRKRKLTPTELKQYAAGYIVEACDE